MPERRGDALTTTRLLFVARGLGPAVAPPTNGPTPDRRPQIPGVDLAVSDETNTVRWLEPSPKGQQVFFV